jgi:hypothetical protein
VLGSYVVVQTVERQTQRQISRALRAGGTELRFATSTGELEGVLGERLPDLLIVDCDSQAVSVEDSLEVAAGSVPVILLSTGPDKAALLNLIRHHDISNLVAKHGAVRAVYPMLDERELLVTCEKVIRRNIFGIEKYIGSWGVVLHEARIQSIAEKAGFLTQFEEFVTDLDCPVPVIPEIVTVADEFIMNAAVHAPRTPDGMPKYENAGLRADLVLQPSEVVEIVYGCDGQRLMLSVTDHFGNLRKATLYNYLARGFGPQQVEVETKPGGAGLGLSFAARSIHQLIFNIHDRVRTEAIAGWYLRVPNAREFSQIAKSLNVFWLPEHSSAV